MPNFIFKIGPKNSDLWPKSAYTRKINIFERDQVFQYVLINYIFSYKNLDFLAQNLQKSTKSAIFLLRAFPPTNATKINQ